MGNYTAAAIALILAASATVPPLAAEQIAVFDSASANSGNTPQNIRVVEFNLIPLSVPRGTDTPASLVGIGNIMTNDQRLMTNGTAAGASSEAQSDSAPAISHSSLVISHYPVAIKLDNSKFTAINGKAFEATADVPYTVGTYYRFKVMVNLPASTYDVWVTPLAEPPRETWNGPISFMDGVIPTAMPVMLAKDFAFAEGTSMESIGSVWLERPGMDCSVMYARLIPNTFQNTILRPEATHLLETDNFLVDNSRDKFVFKFDFETSTADGNAIVALLAGSNRVGWTAFDQLGYVLRANEALFDSIDGNGTGRQAATHPPGFIPTGGFAKGVGYGTLAKLRIDNGVRYHVKMEIDLHANKYSIWVLPEFGEQDKTGEPVKIAEGFTPRRVTPNLNRLAVTNDTMSGNSQVTNTLMLYASQLDRAVAAVNAAAVQASDPSRASLPDEISRMAAALTSTSLGLPLSDYAVLDPAKRTAVAKTMLARIAQHGPYTDDMAILRDFHRAVAAVAHADTAVSPAPSDLKFTVTSPAATSFLDYRARGYLEWSPSEGARYYTVARSTYDPAEKQYGTEEELARIVPGVPKLYYNRDLPDTRYIDTSVTPGGKYRYTATAFNAALAPSEPSVLEVSIHEQKDVPAGKFTNPLTSLDRPDLNVNYIGGHYYGSCTTIDDVRFWKSRSLAGLFQGNNAKVLITQTPGTMYSGLIGGPKLHFILNPETGKHHWFVYFGADGDDRKPRLFSLQGGTNPDDPFDGDYKFMGPLFPKILDEPNQDVQMIVINGEHYCIRDSSRISKMINPWTADSDHEVRIAFSQYWRGGYDWYRYPYEAGLEYPAIIEGPAPLYGPGGEVYLVQSVNYWWSKFYAFLLLEYIPGTDPRSPASWLTTPVPVFATSQETGVRGPGHNTFCHSPDGKEVWNVYHAKLSPVATAPRGWDRIARAQPVHWVRGADGRHRPEFGVPVGAGEPIDLPSWENIKTWRNAKITVGPNGRAWPTGNVKVADTDSKDINVHPDEGYAPSVTVKGATYQEHFNPRLYYRGYTYTLESLTRDVEMHIEFVKK